MQGREGCGNGKSRRTRKTANGKQIAVSHIRNWVWDNQSERAQPNSLSANKEEKKTNNPFQKAKKKKTQNAESNPIQSCSCSTSSDGAAVLPPRRHRREIPIVPLAETLSSSSSSSVVPSMRSKVTILWILCSGWSWVLDKKKK